jgi:Ca2+-binding RTX toxin-like protein
MNSRIRARRSALLLAAFVAVLCSFASSAFAADVASVTIGDGVVRYQGTPGDDKLRLGYSEGETTIGQITGDPITAGPGCELDDKYKFVTCAVPESTRVVVDFGDGNDRLEPSARPGIRQPIEAHGGAGSDQISGNPGNDLLVGGPGADSLGGGDGDDVIDLQDGGPDAGEGGCGEGNDVLKVDPKGVDLERFSEGCETIEVARALGGTAIGGFDDARVRFIPEPGVNHDLVITQEGDGLRMTDPAGIDAGTGCIRDRPGDSTTVFCAHTKDSYATDIDLGDGDDRLRVVGHPLSGGKPNLIGGPGNDTIESGPDGSVLNGGPGDDVLTGRGGYDDLRGEEGNDRLDGGADPDKFEGGAGNDVIDSRDGVRATGGVLGEQGECGAGRDELTVDVSDFPRRTCEKVTSRDTSPAAAGTLQILGGSTLRMSNEKTPSLRIKVRCVGGPCVGAAYLFSSKAYIFPFHATKTAYRLQPGQTATGIMRFGSGFGAFREYLGKKRKLRMYVATLAGDGEGHTKTVRKAVTVTARRGLK